VRWPGRLEWCGAGREVLLDGAHNEGGARVLADYLAAQRPSGVRWVAGLTGGRRLADLFGPMRPYLTALYCTEPPAEGAAPATELQRDAAAAGVPATVHASPADAVEAARAERREGEIVLVAGSLFLVAAVRESLRREEKGLP
jgi:dihydrofolate synthase/folylpolyglutamate synthase